MDVDAAPVLKRKGADPSELWLDDAGPGFPVAFRAAKSRRLDADVPPVVPGAVVLAGDVSVVKRKGADAPEMWLDDDGLAFRATKSRRLDSDVPHVVPGAVAGFGAVPPPPPQTQPVAGFGAVPPPPPQTQPVAGFGAVEEAPMGGDVAVVPVEVDNEERAIVLYRPAEAARSLLLGPLRPGAPLRVSPDWIHRLNGTMLQERSNQQALFAGDENSNLAMVPWAPSRVQAPSTAATATEMMDAEDTSMDVEQDRADQLSTTHQWPQQQHCMVQHPIPVTWSW
uniref:Uncharacterized protein n=2 Tax=Avena sativa TaxID=4498 RepID=A0ACD5Y0T8_AVESA